MASLVSKKKNQILYIKKTLKTMEKIIKAKIIQSERLVVQFPVVLGVGGGGGLFCFFFGVLFSFVCQLTQV